MLAQQIIANLLEQGCVDVEIVGHGYCVRLSVVAKSSAQRYRNSDYDYSEGDKLHQVIGPFSAGISIIEETRSSRAQGIGNFHDCIIPFTNEMTILSQLNGQLFWLARSIAKVMLLSV